jgi:DNA-binding transcriptional LysR family regulator
MKVSTQTSKAENTTAHRALLGHLGDMDLRLLRVFKCVADCGGMAAAEVELNIGTSTVSRHIKDLEIRLGLRLCRRGRAGFSLTSEGQRVYEETMRLLDAVDIFRTGLDDIHQRMGGRLDLALFDKTVSNPEAKVHIAIADFSHRAPDVELCLHVASSNTIVQGLMDGRFQIGVMPVHRNLQALNCSPLFNEKMQLYCGASHPLFRATPDPKHWSDLRTHHFAGLGYNSPNMELSHKFKLQRRATAFDQEGVATLLTSGRYLGFLPDHYAAPFVQQGTIRAIQPDIFQYDCTFVSAIRASPAPSRAAQLFQTCLVQAHPTESARKAKEP